MASVKIQSSEISIEREVFSGAPVFRFSRLPLRTLFDYLEGGHSVSEFLNEYPWMKEAQVCTLFKDRSDSLQEIADAHYKHLK